MPAPRSPGEQRGFRINKNGPIFVGQGQAIAKNAASDVRILVVGNPCNTNCLIAYKNGQDIPADRWHAMTRLDHNRAVSALATKAGTTNDQVVDITIWGNHSNTRSSQTSPTPRSAGSRRRGVITDRAWLEKTFVPQTQERGKFIIDTTRVVIVVLRVTFASIVHVQSLVRGTPAGDWISAATVSKGEYGVPAGLVFGYPCTSSGDNNWKVVEGLKLDAFGQEKFKKSLEELQQEQEVVKDLLPN